MRLLKLIAILVTLLLAGCDQAKMMNKVASPEAESVARGYIDLLRDNSFEEIEKDLDPSMKTADIRNTLNKMAQMIPAQKPESIKVVGAHVNTFNSPEEPETTTTNITLEYQFKNKWLLINVATQKKGGVSTVVGFNVNPIPDSLENIKKFRLVGKSPLQYTVLVLAIIIPLFILYALIQCLRTKIEKRKWRWVIFIMFGLVKFSIDWTTGQWAINPLNLLFLGAGAIAPLYGAWVISISLPLGAVIFLLKRKSLSKQQNDTAAIVPPEPEKEDWLAGLDK